MASIEGGLMKDKDMTNDQLISELSALRGQVAYLKKSETEHKKIREDIEADKKKLEVIIDTMAIGLCVNDAGGAIVQVNESLFKMFGHSSPDEMIRKTFFEYVSEKDLPRIKKRFAKTIETHESGISNFEVICLRKDGSDFPGMFNIRNMWTNEHYAGSISTAQDITDLKRMEDERTKAELEAAVVGMARQTIEGLVDAVVITDLETRIIHFNKASEEFFGWGQEMVGELPTKSVAEIDRPKVEEAIKEFFEKGFLKNFECTVITKDKREAPVSVSATLMKDTDNKPIGLIGVLRDVTDYKLSEEKLRESKEHIKTILDSIQTGIVVIDAETHKIVEVNPVAIKTIGAPGEQIIGHVCHKYICPAEEGRCPITDLGQKVDSSERILLQADGEGVPILKTVAPIVLSGRKCLLESFIDITETKKLEAQLQRAQKMEAIGTLAGGVAHDLNNILSGLVSYPELLLMDLPEESHLRNPILTIQKSGQKAAAIVQDLLSMARRGVAVREVVNLNPIISEYLKSPEYQKLLAFHPNIHIRTNLEPDLLEILGSPAHLSKTVMNLVSNAAEAMPNGGEITISTDNRYIDRPVRGYDYVEEGDYVTLTAADTGIGISKKDLERIFEPFYTKKVMGRSGTGLGMAVVWATVKDYRGYIDVQSTPGKGTTFTLFFPVTREKAAGDKSRPSIEDYMGNGESILVVDDVEEQREIASRMLKKLGYTVTSVSSGEEAIDYLKGNSAHLLILDMIMEPGIDGLETYKKIIEFHPGQKALIVSGFSETVRIKEVQRLGAGAYIRKPYSLEKIGLTVRDELRK